MMYEFEIEKYELTWDIAEIDFKCSKRAYEVIREFRKRQEVNLISSLHGLTPFK